ncbi:hypothetical protein DUT91_21525 [Phyllobacterium salinisoli]|uniref:Uncharacterized protein n=1 Tax=Phyllobacterium salinisoli TaxID=1899321 RepID=A0A368JXK3_9HYPH|nr:hypothetical protein DUT91_21525 [Phyllobacterium salinisoli]
MLVKMTYNSEPPAPAMIKKSSERAGSAVSRAKYLNGCILALAMNDQRGPLRRGACQAMRAVHIGRCQVLL